MKIFVENLEFVGSHGVYEGERREGRRFSVDLSVDIEDGDGIEEDRISETIDYRDLAGVITDIGEGESVRLIESLADRILSRVFDEFERVHHASVTVRKFAPGVPGSPESVGIEMARSR